MKARKPETARFLVRWIVGNTMYQRAYKRDIAAVRFQEYLLDKLEYAPEDVRVIMIK